MKITFTKLPTTDGTIKISLDGGQSFTEHNIADVHESGISLSDDQDYEKIRIKGPANILKNLSIVSSVKVEGENGEIDGSGGGTITPYAKKVYTGRGYVTALIFDHTQITGECSYTDVNGDVVSGADLSTLTTNLYLSNTDITSFELEINGSKVTINVEKVS